MVRTIIMIKIPDFSAMCQLFFMIFAETYWEDTFAAAGSYLFQLLDCVAASWDQPQSNSASDRHSSGNLAKVSADTKGVSPF